MKLKSHKRNKSRLLSKLSVLHLSPKKYLILALFSLLSLIAVYLVTKYRGNNFNSMVKAEECVIDQCYSNYPMRGRPFLTRDWNGNSVITCVLVTDDTCSFHPDLQRDTKCLPDGLDTSLIQSISAYKQCKNGQLLGCDSGSRMTKVYGSCPQDSISSPDKPGTGGQVNPGQNPPSTSQSEKPDDKGSKEQPPGSNPPPSNCYCLARPGDPCDGSRIGNDICGPDGPGPEGEACCKSTSNSPIPSSSPSSPTPNPCYCLSNETDYCEGTKYETEVCTSKFSCCR